MKPILHIAQPLIPAGLSSVFFLVIGPQCFEVIGCRLMNAAAGLNRPGRLILISTVIVAIVYAATLTRRAVRPHRIKSRPSLPRSLIRGRALFKRKQREAYMGTVNSPKF